MRLLRTALIGSLGFFLFAECQAQMPVAPAKGSPGQPDVVGQTNQAISRKELDRLANEARQLRAQNKIPEAQAGMLDLATKLRLLGYEQDGANILRDMSLDENAEYAKAGKRALAERFYRAYLNSAPRNAKLLVEALGWAHYAGADDLLANKFLARVPNKEHENMDARGEQRGKELAADDQLFFAFEEIRQGHIGAAQMRLNDKWAYPIDQLHSVQGAGLLHMAVWYQQVEAVKMLVEQYKANINFADKQNDTPLDYANHVKNQEIIQYLKSKHARANKPVVAAQPAAVAKPAAVVKP